MNRIARRVVTLFTRPDCGLCYEAREHLEIIQQKHPFSLKEVDIDKAENISWYNKYMFSIPVVHVNGEEVCQAKVDENKVISALENQEKS